MANITIHNYESFLLDLSEGRIKAADREALRLFLLSHPSIIVDPQVLFLPLVSEKNIHFEGKEFLKKTPSDVYSEELLNYLENTLSPEEKLAFEKQLLDSSFMAQELALYQKTIVCADEDVVLDNKSVMLRKEEDLVETELYQQIGYVEGLMNGEEKTAFEKLLKNDASLQREIQILISTRLEADGDVVFPEKERLKKRNKLIILFDSRSLAMLAAAILLLFGFFYIFNIYTRSEQKQQGDQSDRRAIVAYKEQKSVNAVQPQGSWEEKRNRVVKKKKGEHKPHITRVKVIRHKEPVLPGNVPEMSNPPLAEQTTNGLPVGSILPTIVEAKSEREIATQNNTGNQSYNTAQFYTLPEEEDSDLQLDLKPAEEERPGFWKKAVAFAQKANRLGIKSVDGEENTRQNYRLTFNNLSVERR